MKLSNLKYIFAAFFIFQFSFVKAQSNWSLRGFIIGVHPARSTNVALMKNKIDTAAKFVAQQGAIISWDGLAVDDKITFRISQCLFKDAAGKLAGYTHLGLNFKAFQEKKSALRIGIGPTFFFRKNWSTLPGYKLEKVYTDKTNIQFKIIALSGEIEYAYYLTKKVDLMFSINHIEPEALTLSVGFTYWLDKKVKRDCHCPSMKK